MTVKESTLKRWASLDGRGLLKAVLRDCTLKTAVVSSFGAESAVLLDLVARVDPSTPVIFVDTGRLFPETLAYQETLSRHLDLLDVRVVRPSAAMIANMDPDGSLYERDPDSCCHARKVMPYALAVSDFDVLVTGRKRHHGDARTNLPVIETSAHQVKVNPLAHMGADEIEAHFVQRKLPRHPLAEAGYASIGCAPCTVRGCPSQGARAGRWKDTAKTECGIHTHVFTDFEVSSLGGQS